MIKAGKSKEQKRIRGEMDRGEGAYFALSTWMER